MYKVQILPKAEEDICANTDYIAFVKKAPETALQLAQKAHLSRGALFGGVPSGTRLPYKEVSCICEIQKHAGGPLTTSHASAGAGKDK